MTILKSIRIDEKVAEQLKVIAEEENRNLSNLINKILADFVNKKK